MRDRSRIKRIRAVVVSLAVIAAGCGSESPSSPGGPSEVSGPVEKAPTPGAAIVHTWVLLESHIPRVPGPYRSNPGSFQSYFWDFGDGTSAMGGQSVGHVYATEGTFYARVTVSSSEGTQQSTSITRVSSLTGRWSGDYGRMSITQDNLELRGRYLDDPREGIVEGQVSMAGTVTFTLTRPGLDPVTFTGTAGPDVMTLEGTAKSPNAVDRPWKLTRG